MFSTRSYRTILVITESAMTRRIVKRVTRHLRPLTLNFSSTMTAAEDSLLRTPPGIIVFDVTRLSESEIRSRLEPFLLNLPGWIRTYFLDETPSEARIHLASELGVRGVLKAPATHYGINAILRLLTRPSKKSKSTRKNADLDLTDILADLHKLRAAS